VFFIGKLGSVLKFAALRETNAKKYKSTKTENAPPTFQRKGKMHSNDKTCCRCRYYKPMNPQYGLCLLADVFIGKAMATLNYQWCKKFKKKKPNYIFSERKKTNGSKNL